MSILGELKQLAMDPTLSAYGWVPINSIKSIIYEYEGATVTTTELTDEARKQIDDMTIEDMLRKWRTAPLGTFQHGDPWSDYFIKLMSERRKADPAAWTAASKSIGWE